MLSHSLLRSPALTALAASTRATAWPLALPGTSSVPASCWSSRSSSVSISSPPSKSKWA